MIDTKHQRIPCLRYLGEEEKEKLERAQPYFCEKKRPLCSDSARDWALDSWDGFHRR